MPTSSMASYDMVIFNAGGVGPTPWAYFDNVYQLPLKTEHFSRANTERFVDPAAWALVQRAAATPITDTVLLRPIYAQDRGGLPPGSAGGAAVVQRRLVPGEHDLLGGLPFEHASRGPVHSDDGAGLVGLDNYGLRPGGAPARTNKGLTSGVLTGEVLTSATKRRRPGRSITV